MYHQYFLTHHNFHQPNFELALQGHYISLPETLIKGPRKLLCTCQRHPTGIALGCLLLFLAHCSRDDSPAVSHSAQVLPPRFMGMSQLSAHCILSHQMGAGGPEK